MSRTFPNSCEEEELETPPRQNSWSYDAPNSLAEIRCAVIMPQPWRGGMLNTAIHISNTLDSLGLKSVSLCFPKGYIRSHVAGLRPAVKVVEFEPIKIVSDDIRFSHLLVGETSKLRAKTQYTFPQALDGELDILLADAWISLTGLYTYGPLLPFRPYIVYAPDLIQRIVPEIYGSDITSRKWRVNAWQCLTMQASAAVFATTPATVRDVICYAGVPSSRVHLLPLISAPLFKGEQDTNKDGKESWIKRFLYPPLEDRAVEAKLPSLGEDISDRKREKAYQRPYFLWVTNPTPHKNHLRALEALRSYYRQGGRLDCVLCGTGTDVLAGYEDLKTPNPPSSKVIGPRRNYSDMSEKETRDANRAGNRLGEQPPEPQAAIRSVQEGHALGTSDPNATSDARISAEPDSYIKEIVSTLDRYKYFEGRLTIAGELDHKEFMIRLRDAAYLWHNVLYDNGTYTVIEAAQLGTRSLVSHYPQMRYIGNLFGINAMYFNPWDSEAAAASLLAMEETLVEEGSAATLSPPENLDAEFRLKLAKILQSTCDSHRSRIV
jgi:glycosyltransferase involved in cell wall biosynthesis